MKAKLSEIEIEYIGEQKMFGDSMPMWNILSPLYEHAAGSTLSTRTLISLGVLVPVADVRFASHFYRVPFSCYRIPDFLGVNRPTSGCSKLAANRKTTDDH
jgi:hypothetical protein